MMGTNCPSTRMASPLQAGDTIKISLWVKMSESAQTFQMFTAHYHPRKSSRWARPKDDSHAISRTLIDNAGKWKYIEAYHVSIVLFDICVIVCIAANNLLYTSFYL